jgi:osmotically-inducible protein OsmY
MLKIFTLIGAFFGAFCLQSCSGILLGTTLTGAYFVSSFTNFYETKEEFLLEKQVKKDIKAIKILREKEKFDADVIVLRNNIFIVGIAKNQASKKYPLDYISSKYSKYKVIDELKIGTAKSSISDFTIKHKIKTKLILTNGIRYANYYFSVHDGEVVVIGYASDKHESAILLDKISSTRGVRKIINYVEIKDLGD